MSSRGGNKEIFRLVDDSVQSNHLHLICEAADKRSLSRGTQGLAIRIARRLDKRRERRGKVFGDRYHAVELRSPFQTRRALVYVINNFRKHERDTARIPFVRVDAGSRVCAAAGTWLLADGWRRHGAVRFGEAPAHL